MTVSETEVIRVASDRGMARFIGEHDLITKSEVAALLAELISENRRVTVDLRNATFVDSSFLHCLMVASRDAKSAGTDFDVLVAPTGPVRSVIQIAGLDDLLEIVVPDDPTAGPLPDGFTQTIVE